MLNYIDFLSPPITFYHLERRTHTSKIGGSLVLIMLVIVLSYISFLIYNLVSHKNITSIFHKQAQFESGNYSFNSTSIFHFFKIFSPDNGGYFGKYDSKYIRIYTINANSNYSYIDSNLELYDHWVFDSCHNNIYNNDLDSSFFSNNVNFTNAACIKYYYNSTEKKYYHFEDKKFFWPYLENGISQINNAYLTTIIQKCTNSSSFSNIIGECYPQKEIDEYLTKYTSIYLFFTDIRVDPTNYKYPIQKYINTIITGIKHNFIENYIHYSPLKIRTKDGNIFGTTKDINSFYFDFNREDSNDNNNNDLTIAKFNHLMENNIHIYERIYKNAFDLISEIGGVIQIIFYIFFWINFIYNKYIVAYDTYSLFFFVQDEDLNSKKGLKNIFSDIYFNENNYIKQKKYSFEFNGPKNDNIFFNNNKNINNVINGKNAKGPYNKTNMKINTDFILKKKKISKTTKNLYQNVYDYNKKRKNLDPNCSVEKLNNNNFLVNKLKQENKEKDKKYNCVTVLNQKNNSKKNLELNTSNKSKISFRSNKSYINNIILSNQSIGKIEHNIIKFRLIMNKESRKSLKRFAFKDSVKSCCFKRNRGSHNFLITFRKHLLSEEHLFKSHIKIVLLEKNHNLAMNENTNILESYNEL